MPAAESFQEAVKRHEAGPWSVLQYPEYHSAKAARMSKILGPVRLAKVDPEAVTLRLFHDGLQNATINKYLSVLDGMGVPVTYLKVDAKEPRILTPIELERLDGFVRQDPVESEENYRAFYGLLRDSGCRGLKEFERFDWSKCDWENRVFTLTSLKGKRTDRQVPMTDTSYNALAWLYQDDRPLTSGGWRKFWLKVRLDSLNKPYDLRHTYCTRLLDAGNLPPTVMRIMGHSSLDMTMHYYHQSPSQLREAAASIS